MSGIIGKREVRGSGVVSKHANIASDIDHDSLANFAANEHYTQANITALGTVTSGTISTGAVIDDPTMTQGSDATGDVYYRAASGKLTRLATGADGTVLTSTGAGAVPAFEAGGSWVKLQNQTISSTPTTAVIGWDAAASATLFTSTYKVYKIICTDLKITTSSTTGIDIHMQVCQSGTTPFAGTNLDTVYFGQTHNNSTITTDRYNNQDFFENFGGQDVQASAASSTSSLEITVFNPSSSTTFKKLNCFAGYVDRASDVGAFTNTFNMVKNTGALTALILYPLAAASATWNDGGIIDLYGIA